MLRRVSSVLTILVPAALACASSSHQEGPRPSYSNVITRQELQQVQARTLYEAIRQLRPRWLQVPGGPRSFSMETTIAVFEDQTYLGTTDELQRMGTEGIYSIHYMDGVTAKASLTGIPGHIQGAIIIVRHP